MLHSCSSQPYSEWLDNRAELVSLYLLLLNYFSTMVRNLTGSTALVVWFWALLIVNVMFVSALAVRVVLWLITDKNG